MGSERGSLTRVVSVAAFLVLFLLGAGLAYGYNTPDGPDARTAEPNLVFRLSSGGFMGQIVKLKTHGQIIVAALNILQGDGHVEVADFFFEGGAYQYLLNGAREADYCVPPAHIKFSILSEQLADETFPVATMSHFYNPSTGKGLVLKFGPLLDPIVAAAREASIIADWTIWTLFGPHVSATDMADWKYGQAVDAMRRGNKPDALRYLGWALHLVADCTVPQHVTDESGVTLGSQHTEYEEAVDLVLTAIDHPTSGGIYNDAWRPGGFAEYAAQQAAPLLGQAKLVEHVDNAGLMGALPVAQSLVPLAERLTAGLMLRFYNRWATENFAVVVASIDRVRDVEGDLDVPGDADFYAKANIAGRAYQTGSIDGGRDVKPNKVAPDNWVFIRWVDLPSPPDVVSAGSLWSEGSPLASQGGQLPWASRGAEALLPVAYAQATRAPGGLTPARKTRLEVSLHGTHGEFGVFWGDSSAVDMSSPRRTFRWSTTEAGVVSARWEVLRVQLQAPLISTEGTVVGGGETVETVVLSGSLAQVPVAGQWATFEIDFSSVLSPTAPTITQTYKVQVIPVGAARQTFLASNPVSIYHNASGSVTQFEGIPTGGYHPRVALASYGHRWQSYTAVPAAAGEYPYAELLLVAWNPYDVATHQVLLTVRDDTPLGLDSFPLYQASSVSVASLAPGTRMVVRVTLAPDGAQALSSMSAKYGNVQPSGGVREFWRSHWAQAHLPLVAVTSEEQRSETRELTTQLPAWRLYPYDNAVPIHIEIWDRDGGPAGGDDHCDLLPGMGDLNLDLSYYLDVSFTRGVERADLGLGDLEDPASCESAGDEDDGDEAKIWLTVEHFPRVPAVPIGARRQSGTPQDLRWGTALSSAALVRAALGLDLKEYV